MKFEIDREAFYKALKIVSRAVSSSAPLPVLSGIRIDVEENKILLTGSDSNISIRTTIVPSESNMLHIASVGAVIMEARFLLDLIRKIDGTMIELNGKSDLVNIKCLDGSYNLNSIQARQYPDIDFSFPETKISLKVDTLYDIVKQTAYACAANDAQRPVLNGVNFNCSDGRLFCSGTDSYRLAQKSIDINCDSFNVTIPAVSLNKLLQSLNGDIGDIDAYINRNKAMFVYENTIFQTRLLDGIYPDVKRIIPSVSVGKLSIDAEILIRAIDRTNFMREDKVHLVTLICNTSNVHIESNSLEIGNSDEILDCQYVGDSLTITCNGNFIIDAVKALKCDNVELLFGGELSLIRIMDPEDDSIVMVTMPVRSYK